MEMKIKNLFEKIYADHSELQIWKKLDNGCYIGTLGYSERNIYILMELLKSFEEQYKEEIDYEAAKEELMLYQTKGKLFVYFNQDGIPISMNGCIYNYDNATVHFKSIQGKPLNSIYFYGLSTLKEFRGQGACHELIKFAISYAKSLEFDYVYARTDLINSNSEWIMAKAGLEICLEDNLIIAEWVPVSESIGDYRLHMWKPLTNGLYLESKRDAVFARNDEKRNLVKVSHSSNYGLIKKVN